MNNQFSLKINTPCSENYDNFSPSQQGGFCSLCQKEVIDFTKMNTQEIANYFQTKTTQNTCGKFKSEQLTTYYQPTPKKHRLSFISGLGLAFIALFSFSKVQGQKLQNPTNTIGINTANLQDTSNQKNITVKGTVTEGDIPLPGAIVILEGTTIGVNTDFDGNFEFPKKLKKGDVLVVSYIGYNSKKIVVQNENSAQNIAMKVNLKMDACVLLGEVQVNQVYSSKNN